jgi:hypothetical protein
MNNESFRIQTSVGQANVWKISDHFYSVLFDNTKSPVIVNKAAAEQNLIYGAWHKIGPVSTEENLPRSFKFYFDGSPSHVFTYTQQFVGNPKISWEGTGYKESTNCYTVENVRERISSGQWIVLPSEPKHETQQAIQELENGVNVVRSSTLEKFFESLDTEADVLGAIKSFTQQSVSSTVRIAKDGTYELYSSGHRGCYANTDEELLELMAAILVVERAINKKVVQ